MRISSGDKRKVFCFENFVIKIPAFNGLQLFLWGWVCNLREVSSWRLAQKRLDDIEVQTADWLCPVKHSFLFSLVIVMEKADIFKIDEGPVFNLYLNDLKVRSEVDLLVRDQHRFNFGLLRGKLVCVDYAE